MFTTGFLSVGQRVSTSIHVFFYWSLITAEELGLNYAHLTDEETETPGFSW